MFLISNAYLDNGLKIILRKIPNQRTVSCGIWVNQGGKDENDKNNGISHLVEHLMFKVNSINSAESIESQLQSLNEIGARYNGTTTKDYTNFYVDGLSSDINILLKVLSGLVVNKDNVTEEQVNLEKEVVLREAERYLISSSQIGERIGQALWGNYSIGQLVIGNVEVIRNITEKEINSLINESYVPENCVLIVVGGFEESSTLEIINKYFSGWHDKYKESQKIITQSKPGIYVDNSFNGERSTIGIGMRGYCSSDWRSGYVELLASMLVKPGSVLFKELREKRGLVYAINGMSTALMSAGNMGIIFSANNNRVNEIVKIIFDELKRLRGEGVSERELENIKRTKKTEILYAIESTTNQLKTIGTSNIRGQNFLLEDKIRQIDKINKREMDMIVKDLFTNDSLCMAVLGCADVDKIIKLIEF